MIDEFHTTYDKESKKFDRQQLAKTTTEPDVIAVSKTKPSFAISKNKHASTETLGAPKPGKKKDKDIDDIDLAMYDSIEYKIDEETRHYLKRVIAANPNAQIALPNGYYDTDEDEAAEKERAKY